MPTLPAILHIAINKPVRHCFDYLVPEGVDPAALQPGMRVQVPFGRQHTLGVLLKVDHESCFPLEKLKNATAILDSEPLLSPALLAFYQWAAKYYHHPIGEVILGLLPKSLRQKTARLNKALLLYQASASGYKLDPTILKRSPRQAALLTLLCNNPGGLTADAIKAQGFSSTHLKALTAKGWIEATSHAPTTIASSITASPTTPLSLNPDQQQAVTQITASRGFKPFLLEGITGSGKTEVYLQVIAHYLAQGKQALVLVPEIGLTPQTIAHFQRRFPTETVVVLHSELADSERANAWLKAKTAAATIIIGTRLAIFTPLAAPGIIIIDEEHDASFKQQTGLRYSARDLAIVRAQLEALPVLLGTATPSLETLNNAQNGRYVHLTLPQRAGNAVSPSLQLIDLRNQYLEEGLSNTLLKTVQQHLNQQNQVLLFLNRRGYAQVLLCHSCGWTATCQRCDAKLILHQHPRRLICHHCTANYTIPSQCGQCQQMQLIPLGIGTERLEQALKGHFPNTAILRIDRDTIRGKTAMHKTLTDIHQGRGQILLGTQMLAKGHHFPNVTLVGIIDIDGGLFSADFRASERMGQLIVQVAGRAGRAEKLGEVLLQTHHPDNALLQELLQRGYCAFANSLLKERQANGMPPFACTALLRAEATERQAPFSFLKGAQHLAKQMWDTRIQVLGPIPAPMERKAGKFRALLLLQAEQRQWLQHWLERFIPELSASKPSRKVRWSLDVDPLEIF